MSTYKRPNWARKQFNPLILLAILLPAIFFLGVVVSDTQAQSVRSLPEAKFTGGGADACLSCHGGPLMTIMAETPHGNLSNPHTPYAQQACESCHGPGSFHASSARGGLGFPPLNDFKYLGRPLSGQFDTCLDCHAKRVGDQAGIGWTGSAHDQSGMSCSSCHQVHALDSGLDDLERQQPLCASCHGTTNSKHEHLKQTGLPLETMKCTTCHNPHEL